MSTELSKQIRTLVKRGDDIELRYASATSASALLTCLKHDRGATEFIRKSASHQPTNPCRKRGVANQEYGLPQLVFQDFLPGPIPVNVEQRPALPVHFFEQASQVLRLLYRACAQKIVADSRVFYAAGGVQAWGQFPGDGTRRNPFGRQACTVE